jgi:hypothetical protein
MCLRVGETLGFASGQVGMSDAGHPFRGRWGMGPSQAVRRIIVLVVLVASTALAASIPTPNGPSAARCRQKLCPNGKCVDQLLTRVRMECQDGDPHCDLDGACDGKCRVQICAVWFYLDGCPTVSAGPCYNGSMFDPIEEVAVGKQAGVYDTGNFVLRYRISLKCKRAARKCNYVLPGDDIPDAGE